MCRIQCGPEHYRDGEYCHYCDSLNSQSWCLQCGGNGLCGKCQQGNSLANGECTPCPNSTYSADGKQCHPVTQVADCLAYHTTQDKCRACSGNLRVGHDNTCRLCIDGEHATASECLPCAAGTHSIVDVTDGCTADCAAFTGHEAACLAAGFCKMALGSCVASGDQTVLAVGLGAGTVGVLAAVAVGAVAVLRRRGWFAARAERKAAAQAEAMALAVFDTCTVDVAVAPSALTFGGAVHEDSTVARDTLAISNRGAAAVVFGVTSEDGAGAVTVAPACGTIAAGATASVAVACRKDGARGDTRFRLVVSVAARRDPQDGRHVAVEGVVRGLADGELGLGELVFGAVLGEGACGVVYRGSLGGQPVAIKEIKKQAVEMFRQEVEMLKTVRGRNVVAFHGAVLTGSRLCHVTELMDLGTLAAVLARQRLPAELKLHALKCIAAGMATVHSFNVVHRDLKPENVLCRSPLAAENADLCKITDFGTSRVAENVFALTMTKGQGTPLYMAPEMLGGHRHYTKAVDVYSYGVLGSVVWNDGQQPYAEQRFRSPLDLQNAVLAGCRPQLPADCPIAPLIRQCWSPNPADRPPFDAICGALR